MDHQQSKAKAVATPPEQHELDVPRCVTPDGSIVYATRTSAWTGGRGGSLHREDGTLRPQRWASERWVYRQNPNDNHGRQLPTDPSDKASTDFTLFFLDEVTALAAGHRPCEVHQASDARRFMSSWSTAAGVQDEDWKSLDQKLHRERLSELGRKKTNMMPLQDLPDGSMFSASIGSCLFLSGKCFVWSTRGYVAETQFDGHDVVEALTPTSLIGVLRCGYEPDIHESILELL